MALHPDAIAKDRTAGKGACRIDGQDAHGFGLLAIKGGYLVYEGTFAHSRGARKAYDMGFARVGIKPLEHNAGRGKFIVDIAQDASYRAYIACNYFFDYIHETSSFVGAKKYGLRHSLKRSNQA
jgi:hypothetical protein